MTTVSELRKQLEELPDDMQVILSFRDIDGGMDIPLVHDLQAKYSQIVTTRNYSKLWGFSKTFTVFEKDVKNREVLNQEEYILIS